MPRLELRSMWLTGFVLAIAVAGCSAQQSGGGDAAGSADASAEASDSGGGSSGGGGALCSIIGEDELAQITGGEITASDLSEEDCSYTLDEGELLDVRYEGSYDPGFETARMICSKAEDLSGIGDEAIWCPDLNVLYFNKGGESLAVQLVYILAEPDRPLKDIATDVARLVAEGL